MKHAYLIMAHNEWPVLQALVECIDDSRNDIYIHCDKKSHGIPAITTSFSKLVVLEQRINVHWGDISQIETELLLFETATSYGTYQYYHLLSGVDLPIKNQDEIHSFFSQNDGFEFIGYATTEITPSIERKVQRWHLFPKYFNSKNFFIKATRAVFLRIQELLDVKRNKDVDFKKGANWVSITDGMARYFIAHKEWIRKHLTHTFCCDEVVIQTLCWMSPFKDSIYDVQDEWNGCKREIGWNNNVIVDWTMADLDRLRKSEAFFARKFNSMDMQLIKEVKKLSKMRS